MSSWDVIAGDSLNVMRGMPAGSVDAIVTSPPYADQRAYTVEALRVLSPTGSMMLNLGIVLRDGEEHDCGDAILANCRAQGWKLLHRLVWHKPNGQVPSAPGYLTVSHEFVLWLSSTTKPWRAHEQPAGSQASREVRTPHSAASTARMAGLYSGAGTHRKQGRTHKLHPDGARPTTVFACAVGGEANPDAHPARMPILLARHLVAMSCPPGGLVLDPFAGNCTTGVTATRSGRRFIGIELNPEYAESGRRRLAEDLGLLGELPESQLSVDDMLAS